MNENDRLACVLGVLPVLFLRFVHMPVGASADFAAEKIECIFDFGSFLIELSLEIGIHLFRCFRRTRLVLGDQPASIADVFLVEKKLSRRSKLTSETFERRWKM